MGKRTRVASLMVAAASAALLLVGAATSGSAATFGRGRAIPPPGDVGAAGVPRTVTLITGDRVQVTVAGSAVTLVGVTPGPGRRGISFAAAQFRGHVKVVPSDVAALLNAQRLDPRLFDVNTLLSFGYDDRRADLPLIVAGAPATTTSRLRAMAGASAVRALPGGGAMRAAKKSITPLWTAMAHDLTTNGYSKVWLDGIRKPTLDVSVPLIGAPAAWAAGYTGTGVKVGVVDTGIDSTHPDLVGKVIAAQDFSGSGNTLDQVGHGTHVAATIASNDTRYRGVAPGAQLLSAKVCADFGCSDSAILAGMQWAAEQGAKVINMSLGAADTPGVDPIEAAVNDLTARFGVLFVVAAGNDGGDQTIESPGSADAALTVGATTKTDQLASFSSRGPRIDEALKPDIAAPGVNIVAARSKDGVFGNPGDLHVTLSGTSMATPHVAGSAAVLAQEHPQWTPAQLKSALMGSALTLPAIGVLAQGAGRVDLGRAITQSVLADPPSLSFGLQQWPHTDDVADARTVTYTNTGPAAVTLDLSLSAAPAGLFTLSANQVTVAAGGTATVTVTSDTRVDIPDARYSGQLVATAGSVRITTPFAVDKEKESHNLALHITDRTGQPTDNFFTVVLNLDTGLFLQSITNDQVLRAPAGRYAIQSTVFESTSGATMLAEPEVTVDHDQSVTMDARNGQPVDVTLDIARAAPVFLAVAADISTADGGGLAAFAFGPPDNETLFAGSAPPHHTSSSFHGLIFGLYTRDGADPTGSPFAARVMWHQDGSMFQGFIGHVTGADLATVHTGYTADRPADGFLVAHGAWPDGYVTFVGPGTVVPVPGTSTEYYNTDGDVRWLRELTLTNVDDPNIGTLLISPRTRYLGGHQYTERRNQPVTGPGFTQTVTDSGFISRLGDTMTVFPVLLNDQLNWYGVTQPTDTVTLSLDRDGTRIFDGAGAAAIDVPAGAAQYRLGQSVTRRDFSGLSTSVSCTWTFRSDTVAGTSGVALPLSVVRFSPHVDSTGTAPAGKPFAVPFQIQQQPHSAAASARTLTVDVSYDDGATWQHATVTRVGQAGVVLLSHPAGAGFVSLRAASTDLAGNTVQQTVIRAYRIA